MKLKTFIKEQDLSIINAYCQKNFNGDCGILIRQNDGIYFGTYYDWEIFLNNNKIIECFDNRYFLNIHGKSHTIILENDSIIPNEIDIASKFAQSMGVMGNLPNILQPFLHLSKSSDKDGYDKYLYNYIKENKIKNVFIDSTFSNKKQFELIAKNVFRWTLGINLFINSHDTLLDTLNDFYIDDDFKRLVDVCNVYDIDFGNNLVYKIEYDFVSSKFHKKSKYYINWGVI